MITNKACLASGTRRQRLKKLWGKSETDESRDSETIARGSGHNPSGWPNRVQATKFRRDITLASAYGARATRGGGERREIFSQHRSLRAGHAGVSVQWLCRKYSPGQESERRHAQHR